MTQGFEIRNPSQQSDTQAAGTMLNDDYLARTYNFNINLPEAYSVFTTAEPNTVWIGLASTPDLDSGFYVRPIENRDARIAALKEDSVKIIQERKEFAVGNVNGHKLTVQTEDDQQITYFFTAAEIEVADANKEAYDAIVNTYFSAEIVN